MFRGIRFMIDLTEIHSLTDFQRNTKEYVGRLKKSGKPLVLTINGKAEVVIQDAASYQKLLDKIERAEAIEGVRRGLEDVRQRKTKPAEQFFEEMEKKSRLRRK